MKPGSDGRYRVRTIERDTNRSPDLVALDTLAAADQVRRRLGQMIGSQHVSERVQVDYTLRWRQAMDAMPEGLLDLDMQFDALTELLRLSQLRTHLSATAALTDIVLDVREVLDTKIGRTTGFACGAASAAAAAPRATPSCAVTSGIRPESGFGQYEPRPAAHVA